ncbi:MAG: hypothetical protein RLZZ15_3063, partial [Verrucomicrobiota bacterium]
MNVVVAGGSGLVGRRLVAELRCRGHTVRLLVRREATGVGEFFWDPASGRVPVEAIEAADAIVNLAGANIAERRWTAARREEIFRSRIEATRTLVTALDRVARRPEVLINASAVGFYGDRGDEVQTEASGVGQGFLPEVCFAWETHAEGAARRGVRTVALRFGVVLAEEGGALAKLRPIFRLGLGGRLGHGRQWLSWISGEDAVAAICHSLENRACRGPLNVVAPMPVTNAEFTAALAHAWRRPAVVPVPGWLLRAAMGTMAEETLLASVRAEPAKLIAAGFEFRHATISAALAAA